MNNASDFVIRKGVLKSCKGHPRKVVIPEGVVEIGKNSFSRCDLLSSVVIPEGVKVIGDYAFNECIKLEKITLPNSTESIGEAAFFLCPLKSIDIPDGVVSIGDRAFSTTLIKKVIIPPSVKHIGTRAFNVHGSLANTGSVREVTILSREITLGGKAFPEGYPVRLYAPNAPLSQFAAEYKRQIIFTYLTCDLDYSPERTEEYKKYIDKTDELIELLIKDRQTAALSRLLQIKTKVKLEKLDAFIEQAKGNGELSAALLAFKNKLFKPADIEKIEERNIRVELGERPRTVSEWKKLFGFKKTDDGLVITAYKGSDVMVEVPAMIGKDVVVAIGERAFSPHAIRAKNKEARRDLKQVILPDTIKEIEKNAFEYCCNLEKIIIPNGVKKIGDRAFMDCEKLTEIVIPEGLEVIDRIFSDCTSLSRVVIPEGVKMIDFGAFYGCQNVKFHAPAGSYAEQYAKAYNIPFVAE